MGPVRQAWICSSSCFVALLTHGLVDEDGEGLGETFESVVEDCFEGIIWEFLFWVFGHHGTISFVVKNEIALIEVEAHLRGQTGFCTPPLGGPRQPSRLALSLRFSARRKGWRVSRSVRFYRRKMTRPKPAAKAVTMIKASLPKFIRG